MARSSAAHAPEAKCRHHQAGIAEDGLRLVESLTFHPASNTTSQYININRPSAHRQPQITIRVAVGPREPRPSGLWLAAKALRIVAIQELAEGWSGDDNLVARGT